MTVRRLRRGDTGYPTLLGQIPDPPPSLWLRGEADVELLASPAVAIVGARACSGYGRSVARMLATEAAAAGVVVVSGLARGVDGEAHRGALAAGGPTVAVLGCGIDRDYPAAHAELARSIVATGGLIVSEYEPGMEPAPWRFPARNRIIAGLARATVVVEARERSGALITADFALEDGREVLVVPGEITSALSAGANGLLRQGATPVTCAADVLEAIGVERVCRRAADPRRGRRGGGRRGALGRSGDAGRARTGDVAVGGRGCRGAGRARARGRGRGGGGGGAQYDRAVTPYWLDEPAPALSRRHRRAGRRRHRRRRASRAARARSRSPRPASASASSTSVASPRARAAATADSRSAAWPAPTTRSSRITAGTVRSRCGAGRRPSSPRWHVSRATPSVLSAASGSPPTARSERTCATRSRRCGRTGSRPSGSTPRTACSPGASRRGSDTRPTAHCSRRAGCARSRRAPPTRASSSSRAAE